MKGWKWFLIGALLLYMATDGGIVGGTAVLLAGIYTMASAACAWKKERRPR